MSNLFGAQVSLDKKSSANLIKAAEYLDIKFFNYIKSDEARVAALLGVSRNNNLKDSLVGLKCKPADVMRYAAAKKDFDSVKLPDRVIYSNLKWSERVGLLGFLESNFDFDYLSEALGTNRNNWDRFFKHIHLSSQPDFVRRFPNTCLSYFIASRYKKEAIPAVLHENVDSLISENTIETTDEGSLVYRTFASRMQTAIEQKDIKSIEILGNKRKGYILRNLTAVANGIYKYNNERFVKFVRGLLPSASVDVLFSILSIDINAKYRVIDIKGDTRVEEANYNPVIGSIQGDIENELYRRFGFKGKVAVEESLKNNIVPFLAKNTNLGRGTRHKVDKKNLYLYVHWIQDGSRTDIDHSFICFDANWKSEMVWYGRQANDYISQSGDITSAPAPHGATEYGCIKVDSIPKNVKYIVPLINVFSGEDFKRNKLVRAGFILSDSNQFNIDRDHTSYNLDQPAKGNIPFVFDVDKKELVVLDINVRESGLGRSAHGYEETIRKVVEASRTKNYISIQKLANILSGDSKETSLVITNKANSSNEIAPESLFSLVDEKRENDDAEEVVDKDE